MKTNTVPNWRGIILATLAVLLLLITVVNRPAPEVNSPLSKGIDAFSVVQKRLEQKKDNYSVYKEHSIIPAVEADTGLTDVHAYAVIDYDSGKVLLENNLSKQVPIASLTKLMTAVVALDLVDPDEKITITQHAANMIPTKIVVEAGEKLTLRELLNAALLTSANDATQAIADGIDAKYGETVFIRAMNEKAKDIGLKNSHFTNPQGFDSPDHYSSVEDLAVLSHYAMQYPVIAEIVKKQSEVLPANQDHKMFDLPNWNGVVGVYPDTIGMKIGNTDGAQFTSIALSQRGGKKILAVVLGAQGSLDRDLKITELLDQGYEMTLNLQPVNITPEQLQAKYATWDKYFH